MLLNAQRMFFFHAVILFRITVQWLLQKRFQNVIHALLIIGSADLIGRLSDGNNWFAVP